MLKKLLLITCIVINKDSFTETLYTIRHVQTSDIPAFKQLYHTVASTSQTLALLPHEVTQEYITELVDAVTTDGLGLVVELDGRLIGWMMKRRYNYETLQHIFYGGSIGVHPDFQGQGIGTKLISHFLQEVAIHHKDILRVEIYALESNPAYRLYQRLGFETEGILKQGKLYPDGRLESYYFMVWFNPNFGS